VRGGITDRADDAAAGALVTAFIEGGGGVDIDIDR
jgi:hypothetical protein